MFYKKTLIILLATLGYSGVSLVGAAPTPLHESTNTVAVS